MSMNSGPPENSDLSESLRGDAKYLNGFDEYVLIVQTMLRCAERLDELEAQLQALREAGKYYLLGVAHTDGCGRIMRSSGCPCQCGHDAFAALLDNGGK